MNARICINNVPVTWEEVRLFDLYHRYLKGLVERSALLTIINMIILIELNIYMIKL